MTVSGIQLFQLLKAKLGKREASTLINFVDARLDEHNKIIQESSLKNLVTKEDLGKEISKVKDEFSKVWVEFGVIREDLAKLEGRLDTKIESVKSGVLKWIVPLVLTMILAILGLYFKH